MLISIILPYWNRGSQLDVTLASIAEQDVPDMEVLLIPDVRKRTQTWMNPAPLWNEGIARASGKILILQNPECKHTPNTINQLARVAENEALFASVIALDKDGNRDTSVLEHGWYCHPEHRKVAWFFCGALHKETALRAGGFDESFKNYGGEDINFAERLKMSGCQLRWTDEIVAYHQWHEYTGGVGV